MLQPSSQSYQQGPPQPLVLSFSLEAQDPFGFYCRFSPEFGPTFLLETGRPAFGQACYSFFGERPYGIFTMLEDRLTWTEAGRTIASRQDPLSALIRHVTADGLPPRKDLPPFVGGAVGFLSYDFVRSLESLPNAARRDLGVPDLQVACYDLVGAVDHAQRTVHLMFTPSAERFAGESRAALYREGVARLTEFQARLTGRVLPPHDGYEWRAMTPHPEQTRTAYMDRVARCQDYIRAGDIYQANLSHRFTFDLSTLTQQGAAGHRDLGGSLYDRLRRVNPSPYSALMTFENLTLVSCSPERLVRLNGRTVETRPIAGTRPRGAGAWEDDRLKHELLANAKERAEHVMLVDLERNDLGRVCRYGTVSVDEFLTVEQYSHVSHLVSNVRGTLRPEATGADVLRSVFPGGTITGVPKVRCMQIIDELEPVRRGIYTGSLGYVSRTGDMDWNILIRTMLLTEDRGYLQVGAGIVADSDPAREYEETMHKGQAFFSALGSR